MYSASRRLIIGIRSCSEGSAGGLEAAWVLQKRPNGGWDEETEKAFRDWAGYENFENKIRGDDRIWGSLYRYLIEGSRRS